MSQATNETETANQIADVARRAAQAGADVLGKYWQTSVAVVAAKDYRGEQTAQWHNVVTEADTAAERAIVDVIRSAFPDHAVIAEESHRDRLDAPHLWVIDPLDGTNNFLHRIPQFAVSIAYYRQGQAEYAVIVNPASNQWYSARRGDGAKLNGVPVGVTTASHLGEIIVGLGFYYDRGRMMRATLAAIEDLFGHGVRGVRRFGAAALDLCMVGCGQFGAFFEYQLAPWDFAAGQLFVIEAGGRVSRCNGHPLDLNSGSVLAASPTVYHQIQQIVAKHWE